MSEVAIISTAHWEGDPRLNRHVRYLEAAGRHVQFTTFAANDRLASLLAAIRAILSSRADTVILPDPDLFLLGSLSARMRGKKPVIDIHEDYAKAASARSWIPSILRPVVGLMARIAVFLGRSVAWRTIVAAPELARHNDLVVLNIPDPESLPYGPLRDPHRLVYVGDVTVIRGAVDMVEVIAGLGEPFRLTVIGRIDELTREEMDTIMSVTGTTHQIEIKGRLGHAESWHLAKGALVGLNLLRPAPAYREAVATKLWEYMAVGLPPVVSSLPGQARLIETLDRGLVCDSVDAAVAVIRILSQDTARRDRIAASGRRMVEEAWAESRPDLALQRALAP